MKVTHSMALKRPAALPARDVSLDRTLAFELVRISERTAIAAARLRGRGDEEAADRAACLAMRSDLQRLAIDGTIVIGDGERGQVDRLYVGRKIGTRKGPRVDVALEPLEGTTTCAKNLPNSISVIALAPEGGLLPVPDVYMDKIAIGPGYPEGLIDLDYCPARNLKSLAEAKGVPVAALTACILDRPRHARLIEEVRAAGASVRLIGDCDVAAVIHTTSPDETGIDIYLGQGGAPEGVLAAAALAALGGQMQGRLVADRPEQIDRLIKAGFRNPRQKYEISDMAHGDVLFAATGITDGNLLNGVRFGRTGIMTHSAVLRSSTRTVRWISTVHADIDTAEFD
jgi:fructose-1,6-bisphosphatase II / sedoheptulose-1,7-bisphosphatase